MLFLIFSFSVQANQSSLLTVELFQKKAESLGLSENKTWQKLLHYEHSFSSPSGLESAIHSDDFFNSPNGRVEPHSELLATISALLKPVESDPNQHGQCRFRARYLWLVDMLDIDKSQLPTVVCSEFNGWSLNGKTDSISIVFATGYLGNPASYYGHTLIKLNSSEQEKKTNLLDVSVNYGVIDPDNSNPAKYIYKALTGGYEAGFSHIQYYFHTHNYGEMELRDLWEYELKLNQKDVDFVVAHAWEVLGKKYTYYFFRKNCAYRMGEILEILDGVDIIPYDYAWVIPQVMIKKISEARYKDNPLVSEVKYYPSRQSRLYQKYEDLNEHQKFLMHKIVGEPIHMEESIFEKEPLNSKYKILDALLDYYQFIRDAEFLPKDEASESYRKVLARRYNLPPGVDESTVDIPVSPHLTRDTSFMQAGVIHNSDLGKGAVLTIRPAYYDVLDASFGHVKNAELTMGELQLVRINDDINIRRLKVVGVHSVKNRVTGLPGDDNSSWKFQFGWESQNLKCQYNCLVVRLQADSGYTWMLNNRVSLGGYLGGAVQDNRNRQGNIYVKGSGFATIDWWGDLKSYIEYEHRQHLGGNLGSENTVKFTTRYEPNSKGNQWDVRLSYELNKSEETSINVGFYW